MTNKHWKVLVVDDLRDSRTLLGEMLGSFSPEFRVVGSAASAAEARHLLAAHEPEIVFLDVEMPGESGFDFLASLPEIRFAVIFHTAYDQYAIQAIKASAVDYLLKPPTLKEVEEALRKATQRQAPPPAEAFRGQTEVLRENFESREVRRLVVPFAGGQDVVEVEDLLYVQGENNYSTLYLDGGRSVVASRTLKDFERMLPENNFLRIHKSYLIHLRHLVKTVTLPGGGREVELRNGASLPVSRRRWPLLRQWLSGG